MSGSPGPDLANRRGQPLAALALLLSLWAGARLLMW